MRNLKKVLSLALALVMLVGMMVVGAGAAEYTDAGEIEYKEAADVLGAINVMKGRDGGNFDPKGDLTRAEGAAIIYRLIMGGIEKDPTPVATGFVDVDSVNHWASGYIAACTQQGILAGVGDNSFAPDGKLSGYAFAKMLLVALGYNASSQGYVGTGWEGSVIRDAYTRNISVDGVVMSNNITREQAAQMAFNTLKATMVTQKGGIQIGDVVIPGEPAADMTNKNDHYAGGTNDEKMQLCELYFPKLKLTTGGNDEFGRPVNVWSYNNEEIATGSAATALVTYTKTTTDTQIAKDLKGYKVNVNGTQTAITGGSANTNALKYTLNGTVDTSGTTESKTPAAKVAALTGNGKLVYVYADSNKECSIVVIEKRFAKLSGEPTTRVRDGEEYVTVPGAGISSQLVSRVSGWENLTKGDVVLIAEGRNTDNEKVYSIELAESITGVVTAKRGNDLRIDGEYYSLSGLTGAATGWKDNDYKNEYTFYLDNGGFIIMGGTEAQTGAPAQYAVVLASAWYTGTSLTAGDHGEVKLLLSDGTQEVKTVAKVNSEDADKNDSNSGKIDGVTDFDIVEYTVNSDDKYELKTISSSSITELDSAVKVTKGSANVEYKDSSKADKKLPVNSATIFFVQTSDKTPKYNAYEGNGSVPTMTGAGSAKAYVKNDVAVAVYIGKSSIVDDTASDYVFIPGTGSISYVAVPNEAGNGVAYYEVDNVIINGEEGQTLKVSATNLGLEKGKLFKVTTKDANTEVVKSVAVQTDNMLTGVNLASGTVTVNTKTNGNLSAYAVNDDTQIIRITEDQTVQVIAPDGSFSDETDEVLVVANNGVAKTVYIIEKQSDVATATITYKVDGGNAATLTTSGADGKFTGTVSGIASDKVGKKVTFQVTPANGASASTPAEVTVLANDNSAENSGTVTITVTSESGKTSTYTITVSKASAAE